MRGHYVKSNKTARTPTAHIAFDCETVPWQTTPDGKTANSVRCICGVYWRREKGRVRSREETVNYSGPSFWKWAIAKLSKQRTTWLWAHNVGFDLSISSFWHLWDDGTFKAKWYVIDDPPVILKGTIDGKQVVLIDSYNWIRSSAKEMGESLGLPKLEMPSQNASMKDWIKYCWRDVEIVEAVVNGLLDMVKTLDLGCLRYTASSQAFRHWRHMEDRPQVLIPSCDAESKLARAGYYSGRAELFYRGVAVGPIYALDVNGMYAHTMVEEEQPCRLLDYTTKATLKDIAKIRSSPCYAATVKLNTDNPYPYRLKNIGTVWPVGEYWTTLVGRELQQAVIQGHAVEITRVASYELAPVCREFALFWHKQRMKWREEGNKMLEKLAKGMPCSFYGKWGQTQSEWIDKGPWPGEERFAKFTHFDCDNGISYPGRIIAGIASYDKSRSAYCRKGNGYDSERYANFHSHRKETEWSFPAISAWITAAARLHMDMLREKAGRNNCYYQCYDCLHVNQYGLDRLEHNGLVHPTDLGKLKIKETYDTVEYYGINMLRINGRLKASGLPCIHYYDGDGKIIATTFERLDSILSRRPDGTVYISRQNWEPDYRYNHSVVTDTGWCKPIKLVGDSPAS